MTNRTLCAAAALCQLLTLFPFAVLCEGAGFGEYVWWHYIVFFACAAVFRVLGALCGAWTAHGAFSRRTKPLAVFASRAAVVVPSAGLCAAAAALGLNSGVYIFVLPACIIAFFGGRRSVDLEYSDVFSRGWFAMYFVAGVVASIILWFVPEKSVSSSGTFQLCVVFGVLTVAAAVLANQTNIDMRTRQRSSGELPRGLRRYNAAVIAGVSALTVGLFLFTKPLAGLVSDGVKALIALVLSLLRAREEVPPEEQSPLSGGGHLEVPMGDNSVYSLLNVLVVGALITLAIRFHREIFGFLRDLFAPLFRENAAPEPLPFADEVTDIAGERSLSRSRRRREQALLKRYRRESDPAARFCLGYALFLCRLSRTSFAQTASDTTTIHAQKGEQAFRSGRIKQLALIYDDVRYGGKKPTEQELAFEESLLRELR